MVEVIEIDETNEYFNLFKVKLKEKNDIYKIAEKLHYPLVCKKKEELFLVHENVYYYFK